MVKERLFITADEIHLSEEPQVALIVVMRLMSHASRTSDQPSFV